MRLGTAKNSLRGLLFTRALVTGAAGLDPALRIMVPMGNGLGEVRQLVGSNEGASRKTGKTLTRAPIQPPREACEREKTQANSNRKNAVRGEGIKSARYAKGKL